MANDLKTQFERAATEAKSLPHRPDSDTLLQLYALFKQATIGDASGKRPGFTDPVGRAKYDSWIKLQGKSQDEAKTEYVQLVKRLKA